MGIFLQYALFPGCNESDARAAVETAVKAIGSPIDIGTCQYAHSYEGTQVLLGDSLGFAPLAQALSKAAVNPVMLLYIYDGDFWGYDFYGGNEEDHFSTRPDCLGPVGREEKQGLTGNPQALAGWFPIWDASTVRRYLLPWSDTDEAQLEGGRFACPGDQYPYGDCWQVTDFAARLGFPWPFDQEGERPPSPVPPQPTLGEILERGLPPQSVDPMDEHLTRLAALPSALSHDYIRRLLEEDNVKTFGFASKSPREITLAVSEYRQSIPLPERDPLCQRLAVLAAFCAHWQGDGRAWGFLDYATYEPVYGSCGKPTNIYVLRARAALTDFSKRHRAWKDLDRLMELDPENQELYQAEKKKWLDRERMWEKRVSPFRDAILDQFRAEKQAEEEKDARRIERILEKRRKKKHLNS